MKSTVEQHNVPHRRKVTVKDVRLVPVIGRHCQSSLKRLEHAYRDCRPAAVLVSRSRFAPDQTPRGGLNTKITSIFSIEAFSSPSLLRAHICRSGKADLKILLRLAGKP